MKKVSQILGGLVVVAICVVFIVQFRPATDAPMGGGPECAAELHGRCIRTTHFWAAYRLIAPRGASAAQLKALGLKGQVMNGLVERELLLEEAERLGITVSDDDVSRALARGQLYVSLPAANADQLAYQLYLGPEACAQRRSQCGDPPMRLIDVRDPNTGKFDADLYEKQVRLVTKLSATEFREFQKAEMTAARMRDMLEARVQVSERAARLQFEREKSTATARYVKLSKAFYAEHALDKGTDAVDAWAAKNKDELKKIWEERKMRFLPECRVAERIFVRIDPTSLEALEPEKQLAAATAKIDDAKKRLTDGEALADVAKEMSDGPEALTKGGSLGCIGADGGNLTKPVLEAIAKLEPGAWSEPVRTMDGLHLLRVDRVAKGEDAEKEGLLQTKEELYIQMETERLAAEGSKAVLKAVADGASMEDAVNDHIRATLPPELVEIWRAQTAPTEEGGEPKEEGEKKEDGEPSEGSEAAPDAEGGVNPVEFEFTDLPVVESTLPFNVSADPIPGIQPGPDVGSVLFGLKPGAVAGDVFPLMEGGYAVAQLVEIKKATEEQWEQDGNFYLNSMRRTKRSDYVVNYLKQLQGKVGGELKLNRSIVSEGPEDGQGEGDQPAPPQ